MNRSIIFIGITSFSVFLLATFCIIFAFNSQEDFSTPAESASSDFAMDVDSNFTEIKIMPSKVIDAPKQCQTGHKVDPYSGECKRIIG